MSSLPSTLEERRKRKRKINVAREDCVPLALALDFLSGCITSYNLTHQSEWKQIQCLPT